MPDLHGLPPEARGNYTAFIKKQLSELLKRYEPDLLWIDQYPNRYTGQDWLAIKAHIKSVRPGCLVIANNSLKDEETDIHSYELPWLKNAAPDRILPPATNTAPAEVCDFLTGSWFWKVGENETRLRKAKDIADLVRLCNGRRANYLLNVPPDRTGRIPSHSVERLKEIGKLLEAGGQK
jgi:alpha-L-fucosidase